MTSRDCPSFGLKNNDIGRAIVGVSAIFYREYTRFFSFIRPVCESNHGHENFFSVAKLNNIHDAYAMS